MELISGCNCHSSGSKNLVCTNDGVCNCKDEFSGQKCDKCALGYFGFPFCISIYTLSWPTYCPFRNLTNMNISECNCNEAGSKSEDNGIIGCTVKGNCNCKEGYFGEKCDKCSSGYYDIGNGTCIGRFELF